MTALEAAEECGRPLHFIPHANHKDLRIESDTTAFLPRVGIQNLIQRNIYRFKTTGRFIPTKAIIDTNSRADQLIRQATADMIKSNSSGRNTLLTKLDLDIAIANIAGFRMRNDRTVYRFNQQRNDDRYKMGRGGRGGRGGHQPYYDNGRGRGRGRGTGTGRGRGRNQLYNEVGHDRGRGRFQSGYGQRGNSRYQSGEGEGGQEIRHQRFDDRDWNGTRTDDMKRDHSNRGGREGRQGRGRGGRR